MRSYILGNHTTDDAFLANLKEDQPAAYEILHGDPDRISMLLKNEKFLEGHLCWGKENICSAFALLASTLTASKAFEDGMNPEDKKVLHLLAANPAVEIGFCGQENKKGGTPHFFQTMAQNNSPYLDFVRTILVRRHATLCLKDTRKLHDAFSSLKGNLGAILTSHCTKSMVACGKNDFPFPYDSFSGITHIGLTPITEETIKFATLFVAQTCFDMARKIGRIKMKDAQAEEAKLTIRHNILGTPTCVRTPRQGGPSVTVQTHQKCPEVVPI